MKNTILRNLRSVACLYAFLFIGSTFSRLPCLFGQTEVTVEVTPDDKVEVAWPFTGLDQELEVSNDLAAESWSKVNAQISFAENRYQISKDYDGSRQFYRVSQVNPPNSEITTGLAISSDRQFAVEYTATGVNLRVVAAPLLA